MEGYQTPEGVDTAEEVCCDVPLKCILTRFATTATIVVACKSNGKTAHVGSDNVSMSAQGALRCCDDNNDYDVKGIGEGWGRWDIQNVSLVFATSCLHDHVSDVLHTKPKP